MGHVPLEANTLDVKMPARDDTMALTLKAWYVRVQCGVRRWDGMGWDGREWYFLPLFTLGVKIPAWGDAMALSLNVWSNRDVVVWFKTTWERVKFHPHTDDIALPMLPYQKSLHATAERLLARLPRPLIAVHFRSEFIAFRVQESMQEDMVSQGGKANASMVQQRLDCGPSVFIAADVPFNESAAPARSDSWTEMVQWYDGDSRVLKSSSAALHRLRRNVHGTVMIDEIMPEVNEFDPGVVAILDKLVCAHANVFLAGSWACGGGRGYETDIMKHRRQAGYSDDTLKRWAEEQ
ncbi:unnamed protein product [Closterium sp. NIES-64]|nr:unnamed protein product [Closterium sp. NIES-64]